jgi:hypothetical protein
MHERGVEIMTGIFFPSRTGQNLLFVPVFYPYEIPDGIRFRFCESSTRNSMCAAFVSTIPKPLRSSQ